MQTSVQFINTARDPWGAEESMVSLAAELKREGHVVSLHCFSDSVRRLWISRVGESAIVFTPRPARNLLPRALGDCIALIRAPLPIASINHFVVFSHALVPAIPFRRIRLRAGNVGKQKWTIDLHDELTTAAGRLKLAILPFVVHKIIAVSNYIADTVHTRRRVVVPTDEATGQPRHPIEVPDSSHANLSAPESPATVAMIGRIDPEKQHLLVGAALTKTRTQHRFLIRGASSPVAPEWAQTVKTKLVHDIGDRVRFAAKLPSDQAYSDVDILVVANDREPLGRTVREAQMRGIPVIVPDKGGAKEMVRSGETGWIFIAGDATSLADAIDSCWGDRSNMINIISRAKPEAERLSDPHDYATKYLSAMADSPSTN